MRKILLIVVVLASMHCFGQKTTQENDDSLYVRRQLMLLPKLNTTSQVGDLSFINRNIHEFNPANEFSIPQSYYLPLLSLYQPDNPVNKFMLDMHLTNQFIFNDVSSISTTHIQSNFIGLGGLNLIQANYNINIDDRVIFSPGIYTAKFNIYNDFLNDAGLNGNIKILLSDRININLFGQYSIRENNIAISPFISPLYPHSNFGGALEFKVNDNWGIQMGAENEYDVFLRKWVTRPFIMPVFYK